MLSHRVPASGLLSHRLWAQQRRWGLSRTQREPQTGMKLSGCRRLSERVCSRTRFGKTEASSNCARGLRAPFSAATAVVTALGVHSPEHLILHRAASPLGWRPQERENSIFSSSLFPQDPKWEPEQTGHSTQVQ